MERIVLKLGMFETLMVAVIAIYVGEFLRNKIPVLKKYCLPAAVVGGTLFALISLLLYSVNIFELNFDYKTVNQLFYCLFFAASGAAASLALLKKAVSWLLSLPYWLHYLPRCRMPLLFRLETSFISAR